MKKRRVKKMESPHLNEFRCRQYQSMRYTNYRQFVQLTHWKLYEFFT